MDLRGEAAPVKRQGQAEGAAAAMGALGAHEDRRRLAPDLDLLDPRHAAPAVESRIAIRQAEGPQVKSVVCR